MWLLWLFVAVSCMRSPSVPKGFPREAQMAELMADLYFAEATLSSYPNGYREQMDRKSTGYYREVLNRHGYTKTEYDSILAWYSSEPYLLSKVYDRVISLLGEREARLKNELKQADSLSKMARLDKPFLSVSNNLWKDTLVYRLPAADTIPAQLVFAYPLDSVVGGVLNLEASYRFDRGTTAHRVAMMLSVAYADSSADTVRYELDRSFQLKNNQVTLTLQANRKAVRVYGLLAEHDTLKQVQLSVEKVRLLHLPKLKLE